MKSTITLIPDERVVSIFKKVAGSFSNKFSSQLLEIVLNSLKSKYIEKYLQANSQVATLDSQILKAKKENELAQIAAQTTITNGEAITEQQLRLEWIKKWSGEVPHTIVVSNKEQVSMFLPPSDVKK